MKSTRKAPIKSGGPTKANPQFGAAGRMGGSTTRTKPSKKK